MANIQIVKLHPSPTLYAGYGFSSPTRKIEIISFDVISALLDFLYKPAHRAGFISLDGTSPTVVSDGNEQ